MLYEVITPACSAQIAVRDDKRLAGLVLPGDHSRLETGSFQLASQAGAQFGEQGLSQRALRTRRNAFQGAIEIARTRDPGAGYVGIQLAALLNRAHPQYALGRKTIHRQLRDFDTFAAHCVPQGELAVAPLELHLARITSYNVCYTKLLRR